MQDVGSEDAGGGGAHGHPLLSAQCFCKPTTTLKNPPTDSHRERSVRDRPRKCNVSPCLDPVQTNHKQEIKGGNRSGNDAIAAL